jgi:5-methylthioadenosine/S-adenosylhomocysteine deaminase
MRCQLSWPILDFPSAWASGADDYISRTLALRDQYKNRPLVEIAFGPHAPYTVSAQALQKVATFAHELDMAVQIHLHETVGEVLQAVEATGERPVDSLRRIGLLGPRTQCVHMTDLGEQDIATIAETGAHVVHCPQSNMKLASGACPVTALQAAGVNVALGSDGAASNNDLNLFGEMHSAALLAKLRERDAAALPAAKALEMATLGGARALGLEGRIGSLVPGKQADVIAVDLARPSLQPLYNPISQLVYAASGAEVTHSWVAGRCLLRERRLTTLDLDDLLARSAAWAEKIR